MKIQFPDSEWTHWTDLLRYWLINMRPPLCGCWHHCVLAPAFSSLAVTKGRERFTTWATLRLAKTILQIEVKVLQCLRQKYLARQSNKVLQVSQKWGWG